MIDKTLFASPGRSSANQSTREFIRIIKSVQENNKIGTLLTDQYEWMCSKAFRSYLAEEDKESRSKTCEWDQMEDKLKWK